MALIPFIVEQDGKSERAYDIYSRLLKDNIIFIGSEINDDVANSVIAQLLYLEAENSEREISLYINSPGGSITSGLAIYDTMQLVTSPISTICVGQAASMAAVILASGTPGKRHSLPNSRIILHQPFGGFQGQASDVAIHAKEILRVRESINSILIKHTNQAKERIQEDLDRDFIMTPDQAREYGIIDDIIVNRSKQK
ncbi:MAG: ATP-dependent Clp protease proteolytic subunit [Candidatus Aminicenantes bacterium]|nr:MAG: ATP-dependent Clp protease proteolytic subunit [Candidatus Aminicenantes bacterium]